MSKPITSEILVAYSKCVRKAFLLLCTKTRGTSHEYTEILNKQRQTNQRKYLDIFQRQNTDVQSYNWDILKGGYAFLINATLKINGLVAECTILSKVGTPSALGQYCYEPIIFINAHSIKKEHKLELFFVSYVLEQIQDKRSTSGRIIGLDRRSHKINFSRSRKLTRGATSVKG